MSGMSGKSGHQPESRHNLRARTKACVSDMIGRLPRYPHVRNLRIILTSRECRTILQVLKVRRTQSQPRPAVGCDAALTGARPPVSRLAGSPHTSPEPRRSQDIPESPDLPSGQAASAAKS
jgi:hypothetical protein